MSTPLTITSFLHTQHEYSAGVKGNWMKSPAIKTVCVV